MTVSLKEAKNALWVLQQFLDQLAQQEPATERQLRFIKDLCRQKGKPEPANLSMMSKEEASALIDELLKER
ncbi:MAG: hypothetical protein QXT73_03180 [Candidatus Methanomethylicaceae archaeon]